MSKSIRCGACGGCAKYDGEVYLCSKCGEETIKAPQKAKQAPESSVKPILHAQTEPAFGLVVLMVPPATPEMQREAAKRFYPTAKERAGYVRQDRPEVKVDEDPPMMPEPCYMQGE